MSYSTLDQAQIIKTAFNAANGSLNVTQVGGPIITSVYDNLILAYTGSNLTSVQYLLGAVLVNTLTLGYDGSNNLITVVKT